MLEQLKEEVYQANLDLPKHGLVKYTWGNVSAFDPETRYFVIKPSGVSYEEMTADDMVVVDLDNHIIEGKLNPSSDTPTHAVLYRSFPQIGGIVHTHSTWATIWTSRIGCSCDGDDACRYFLWIGTLRRFLTQQEIDSGYEYETGKVIIETFKERKIDPLAIPGVLLHGHGPFTWGKDAQSAVMNAVVLDEVCKMNLFTRQLNSFSEELPQRILDKHYLRKHGKNAYYGQNK
ncbi:L-ribulose-5-phosphate 4-epimerase [Enterococcus faecium]|nr:L-ribulose-5-phosphate 4-epimerase [Enterococcus faecium]